MRTHSYLTLTRWHRLLLAMLLLGGTGVVPGQTPSRREDFDFKGRLLVAVSDADMVPSAYYDGHLGPLQGADALSVIRLEWPVRNLKAVQVGVSNSVTGPPSLVAVTPDGRYAIVAERLGPRPAGKANPRLDDLPAGRTLTVVDLANPDQPRAVQLSDPLADTARTNHTGKAVSSPRQAAFSCCPSLGELTVLPFSLN